MTFLASVLPGIPQSGSGRPYALTRLAKIFSDNDMVALEASINAFLNSLKTSDVPSVIFDIIYLGTQGSASRVLVSYGLLNPAT